MGTDEQYVPYMYTIYKGRMEPHEQYVPSYINGPDEHYVPSIPVECGLMNNMYHLYHI